MRIISCQQSGRIIKIVIGKIAQQNFNLIDRIFITFAGKMCVSAFCIMSHRSAEFLECGFLSGHGFDHAWTGDEHITSFFYHEHKISHCRRINCSSGSWSHNNRNLGNNSRCPGITEENIPVAAQGVDSFLNSRSAGIIHPNDRNTRLHCQIHHFNYLAGMLFSKRTTARCKILGKSKKRSSVHQSMTCDNSIGRNIQVGHIEICRTVFYQHIDLTKSSLVKEQI